MAKNQNQKGNPGKPIGGPNPPKGKDNPPAKDPEGQEPDTMGLEGIALFPEIPEELGIDPLLESLLSMVVFITASDENLVDPKAADEAFAHLQVVLSKLDNKRIARMSEELEVVAGWVKDQGLGLEAVEFIETFLDEMGVDLPS